MRLAAILACVALAVFFAASPASAEKRVALIVGNGTYVHVPRLANPRNDAELIAKTLKSLGFTLIGDGAQIDLDKAGFDNAVQSFGAQLQGADVGLFYYAGHGLQVRGANYLVPVGANPTKEADVDFQMLDANLVLRQMEGAGTKLNVVILDACRNNPFGGRGLRATSRGLAQMQAPEGTLISYATQPGNVAQDGSDGDSPYTKALAQTMRRAGLDIFQTFNEVGLAVKTATGGSQQPWVSSSPITGNFYFSGDPQTPSNNAPPVATGPDASERAWTFVKDTASPTVLEDFIRRFGDSIYGTLARDKLEALKKSQTAVVAPPPPAPTTIVPPSSQTLQSSTQAVFTTGNSLGPTSALPMAAPESGSFPTRPIKIIVPFGPGGPPDLVARIVAGHMSESLGQPVIIENRLGAVGIIGTTAVAKSNADGYTLLMGGISTHVFAPALQPNIPYNPRVDFTPIGLVSASPIVIVAGKNFQAKDLRELITFLKMNPSRANFASLGPGNGDHMACSEFNRLVGVKTNFNNSSTLKSSAEIFNAIAASQYDYGCMSFLAATQYIRDGGINALAVTSSERVPSLDSVPTTREVGLPELQYSYWTALFAPSGTPQAIIKRLSFTLSQALENSEVRRKLVDAGSPEIPARSNRSPEALAAFLAAETEKWTRTINVAGIKLN